MNAERCRENENHDGVCMCNFFLLFLFTWSHISNQIWIGLCIFSPKITTISKLKKKGSRENDRNKNCAPVVRKIAFYFVGMFIALHEKVYCLQRHTIKCIMYGPSYQQLWIWNFRWFLFCSFCVFRWFSFTLLLLSVIFLFYFYYIRFGSIKFDCIASRCACMRVICWMKKENIRLFAGFVSDMKIVAALPW